MQTSEISNPSPREKLLLRLLIAVGLLSMFFFLKIFMSADTRTNTWLYWLLMVSFVFTCLKILYEWWHYLFITVPPTPKTDRLYTVDIFTTFCAGEPYEMMEETLAAIQQITYPHQAYLCDESNDPYLRNVCQRLGIHHITRTEKKDAKAGNINNGLRQANGELCVILDPDHVPFPGFLDPIVPHFGDPKVGFVQVVQAYKNGNQSFIAKGAAQQTYQFYGPMMMTMNQYGTVLAIGANCTFRRAALDSIGGHAAGLAEDMHTAMHLHAKGWKSVYVPRILSLGLVPSTLSAYYKQQLKWSRGVFELLVTTYRKQFHRFSLLQKIHYGTIPLYYLSGFVFLINFLVPVVSLFTDQVPSRVGLLSFGFVAMPFGFMIVLIRHYVQKWVAMEEERGFHMVGGLLVIGTWWIFILGVFYTLIRKKVPYVPTPKDGNEANNWPLNIPNLVVLAVSLAAIVYGLYNDWNPYMWFMAFLALLNCLIISVNIFFSRQASLYHWRLRRRRLNSYFLTIRTFRSRMWLFRRRMYTVLRDYPIVFLTVFFLPVFGYIYFKQVSLSAPPEPFQKERFLLSGIFDPLTDTGISSLQLLGSSTSRKAGADIVSGYISWGDGPECFLPAGYAYSIYNAGSIPLITWEPWQRLFNNEQDSVGIHGDREVFKRICEGRYDAYIRRFCHEIASFKRPVFIRFAHEFDNPAYPWSSTGGNTAESFRLAWQYLHHFFSREQVDNVAWVYTPWQPESIETYYPGPEYVDWIGIDVLDYATTHGDQSTNPFSSLYTPFRKNKLLLSGKPVMISEMGKLGTLQEKQAWLKEAVHAISTQYPEIKAYVLFNSAFDDNVPAGNAHKILDWRADTATIRQLAQQYSNGQPPAEPMLPSPISRVHQSNSLLLNTVRAVNYTTGHNWAANYYPVLKANIKNDFGDIADAGLNAVKIYEYGVYERSVLAAAAEKKLHIIYTFWIPEKLDFIHDNMGLLQLERKILSRIDRLKTDTSILAWDIGGDYYQKLFYLHDKPALYYQQKYYVEWLRRLMKKIHQLDSKRKTLIELKVDDQIARTARFLFSNIYDLDGFGFICDENSSGMSQLPGITEPFFFSSVSPGLYLQHDTLFAQRGFALTEWQDQQQWQSVSFAGLKDINGNRRQDLIRIAQQSGRQKITGPALPVIRILRPAATNFPGSKLNYQAVIQKDSGWISAYFDAQGLTFNWWLVRADQFGRLFSSTKIGTGPLIKVTIPEEPDQYRIYVTAEKKGQATSAISRLNLPLEAKF